MRAPSAHDVEQLRTLCPGLTFISIDIAMKGKWLKWPYDVLDQLVRFRETVEVELSLHMDLVPRIAFNRLNCRKAFKYIRCERRRLGMPCNDDFQIGFKVVGSRRGKLDSTLPDYNFWLKIGLHAVCGGRRQRRFTIN